VEEEKKVIEGHEDDYEEFRRAGMFSHAVPFAAPVNAFGADRFLAAAPVYACNAAFVVDFVLVPRLRSTAYAEQPGVTPQVPTAMEGYRKPPRKLYA